MLTFNIKGKEYKVKFGYNSFCDTDLLDKTSEVMGALKGEGVDNSIEFTRKMFNVTRELLFEGFKKYNPVEKVSDIGNLLDDYYDENPKDNGLVNVFASIAQELLNEGFFGNLLTKASEAIATIKKKNVSKKNPTT